MKSVLCVLLSTLTLVAPNLAYSASSSNSNGSQVAALSNSVKSMEDLHMIADPYYCFANLPLSEGDLNSAQKVAGFAVIADEKSGDRLLCAQAKILIPAIGEDAFDDLISTKQCVINPNIIWAGDPISICGLLITGVVGAVVAVVVFAILGYLQAKFRILRAVDGLDDLCKDLEAVLPGDYEYANEKCAENFPNDAKKKKQCITDSICGFVTRQDPTGACLSILEGTLDGFDLNQCYSRP